MDTANQTDPLPESRTDTPESTGRASRRDFTRTALAAGVLSTLSLATAPRAALAWLDGTFHERDDLGDAFKALVNTYSDVTPYPRKFNDALVRLHLRDLDFAVSRGVDKEFAAHFVLTLSGLIHQYIKPGIPRFGKDIFLWGIFERTTCSYQLYETIDIKNCQRSVPCPYKPMLDNLKKELITYDITWNDVCSKWCIPVWQGFAGVAGVDIKVTTGLTCTVQVI
jgi:hypothetical protein